MPHPLIQPWPVAPSSALLKLRQLREPQFDSLA